MIKDQIESVEKSAEFKKKKNLYLAHVFFMLDEPNKNIVQVGYCTPEQKIVTFVIDGKKITAIPEAMPYKNPKAKIKKLEISKVKVELDEALGAAKELQEKKYAQHKPFKQIVILQNIDEGQVWNITFITQTFNTLNIKISAETGKVVRDELISLVDFDHSS